jgi:uncharacterized membrane protein HdeD (DUF308 family)
MKVGVTIGAVGILIGLILMASGNHMCRTSCWADDIFRYILPESWEKLSGGIPSVIVGVAIIVHAVRTKK